MRMRRVEMQRLQELVPLHQMETGARLKKASKRAQRPKFRLGNSLNTSNALRKSPLRRRVERVQRRAHSPLAGFDTRRDSNDRVAAWVVGC